MCESEIWNACWSKGLPQSHSPENWDCFFAAALAFCLNCSNCWQIRSFHPISPRSLSPWLGWDKTEEMDGGVVEEDDEGDDGEPALAVVLLPPLQHWARSPLLLPLLQTWQSITCIYPVYKVANVIEKDQYSYLLYEGAMILIFCNVNREFFSTGLREASLCQNGWFFRKD